MEKALIGVQLYTVREEIAKDGVYETLKKLSELGFKSMEQSGFDLTEHNLCELERAIKDFGIEINAVSADLMPAQEDAEGLYILRDMPELAAACKRIGCEYVRIGAMPASFSPNRQSVLEFTEIAEKAAAELLQHGIKFYYHNHHFEFVKDNGEYLLDIMRKSTKELGFELDTHWIMRGGVCPLDYIGEFSGRMDVFHIKDYRIAGENGGAVWQIEVQFAEAGEGSLPMKQIIEKAAACGSRYIFIEQDTCYTRTPFESLALSRKNLEAMGFEEWF